MKSGQATSSGWWEISARVECTYAEAEEMRTRLVDAAFDVTVPRHGVNSSIAPAPTAARLANPGRSVPT